MIGGWALSEVADSTGLSGLLSATSDRDPEVRAKVAKALARIPGGDSLRALVSLARDPVWFVRLRALDALGSFRDPAAAEAVLAGLEDEVAEVRYRASFALRQIGILKDEKLMRILATRSPQAVGSLISEWDRSGFLWNMVAGLSTRDWPRFLECLGVLRALIAAGATQSLLNYLQVLPEIKIRLRLLRLLMEGSSQQVQADLQVLAELPGLDPRVSAAIREYVAAGSPLPAGSGPIPEL